MSHARLGPDGVDGDRLYSLIDRDSGLPAAPEKDHRWRKALHLQATSVEGGLPMIGFPDGTRHALDESGLNGLLSDYFGFATAIATHRRGVPQGDFPSVPYRHLHFPVHLLTTMSLRHLAGLRGVATVDVRRFRPTLLIDAGADSGFAEDAWVGRRLRLGEVDVHAEESTKRCGITLISQPGIGEDPDVLRNILRHNKRHLGIYCSVTGGGTLHPGDGVSVDGGGALFDAAGDLTSHLALSAGPDGEPSG